MAAPTLDEIAHQVGPQVARAFAPYFIEELRQLPEFNPRPLISNDYDPATCAVFVMELGDDVVKRADKFFTALDRDGKIDSLKLAKLVGAKSPRALSGTLTSLKKRARTLGLERPWDEPPSQIRTIWVDRNGISLRMLEAIKTERARRKI
jgi:hypothetical protein